MSRFLLLALLVPAVGTTQVVGLRTVRLADGVYATIRTTLPEDASDANTTIIINDDDVIVVDANITPGSSRAVIAEIKRLTPKPVRYVINTHWHSDHFYGNAAYAQAYPGVEFIAHANTRADIIAEDLPSFEKNVQTEYPAIVARLKNALATGKRSNGAALTTEDRTTFAKQLQLYEWFLGEARTFQPLPPTLTVADSLVLHRGDRRIVVRYLGRANTRGDLIVYLPNERILATGDIVVSPIPFSFGSFPGDWVATLQKLKGYAADVIIPGHGEPQHDWTYVDRVSEFLSATLAQVRAAGANGAPLDSVRKVVTLDAFRDRFAGTNAGLRASFDVLVNVAVERAYREVRGELTPPRT